MKKIIAYKVFNPDWTCRDLKYEVGKTYKLLDGKKLQNPVICERGFHACILPQNCFNYYSFDPTNKVALVELSGTILGLTDDKQCSNIITIIEEISWEKLLTLVNTGKGNSGQRNSGDGNSGNRNSGDRNSGDGNSGDENSGYGNSGDENSGYRNSGNRNSGYRNSGNRNSGDENSGDGNSGDGNSGDRNSGDRNSGDRNSGDENSGYGNSGYGNSGDGNSGDRNSGDGNSGYRNSGNRNSGNRNSGDGNSGDRNSGSWNSCNFESGMFNSTISDKIRVFNKECLRKDWKNATKPNFIYFDLWQWISFNDMSEQEKIDHPKAFITDGYLKTFTYKEAWANSYAKASKEDIKLLKALPNFDADVFEEITGIKIE